jgi:hypothetical protein
MAIHDPLQELGTFLNFLMLVMFQTTLSEVRGRSENFLSGTFLNFSCMASQKFKNVPESHKKFSERPPDKVVWNMH